MSSSYPVRTDGSAAADAHEQVTIDRDDPAHRYRYVCPNGHVDWEETNSHIWCRGCRRRYEAGDGAADPEHWEILDKKTGETIPWSAVALSDGGSDR